MREHIIGVSVSETIPDAKIDTMIVIANSRKIRPTSPGINTSGRNTAASEIVIDKIVKLICLALLIDASSGPSPCSIRLTVFSKNTIASSTRNPIASVSAISDKLSRLYPSICITMNVISSDSGSATTGISVSAARPKNAKITSTTSTNAITSVSCTSLRRIDDRCRPVVNQRQSHRRRKLRLNDWNADRARSWPPPPRSTPPAEKPPEPRSPSEP